MKNPEILRKWIKRSFLVVVLVVILIATLLLNAYNRFRNFKSLSESFDIEIRTNEGSFEINKDSVMYDEFIQSITSLEFAGIQLRNTTPLTPSDNWYHILITDKSQFWILTAIPKRSCCYIIGSIPQIKLVYSEKMTDVVERAILYHLNS